MSKLEQLQPSRVFHYFEQLSAIPRGSGNRDGIAAFCEAFASEHHLRCIRDKANNVILFKDGTAGYEHAAPVILQGHLDMVCQKVDGCTINFEKDGIDVYVDDDFVKARGTTLGADNGIAVAMILAILESNCYAHPPIEAVFTADEEIGMLGAMELDMSVLTGRQMINIDSEEEGTVTVSCAGGADVTATLSLAHQTKQGTRVTLAVKGLQVGHSGTEINSGRINADLLTGRILDELRGRCDFDIIRLDGGDKTNAIPPCCTAELCVEDVEAFRAAAQGCLDTIQSEISHREPTFAPEITIGDAARYTVWDRATQDKLLCTLLCVPNGVMQMSAEIEGLVETSLNLGILKTGDDALTLGFSLRSNKKSAQRYLERRLCALLDALSIAHETTGYYPPWEFRDNSRLQELYCQVYAARTGRQPEVAAIHAGLECGVFASAMDGLDCISVGPAMMGVHTTGEKLSISSTGTLFEVLLELLKQLQ